MPGNSDEIRASRTTDSSGFASMKNWAIEPGRLLKLLALLFFDFLSNSSMNYLELVVPA